jgi:hypothetical protein
MGGMLDFTFLLGQVLGLPEIEDPIPDRIGLGHLISLAGAGGVLGGISKLGAPSAGRERAIGTGSLAGLVFGTAFYCLALLGEVISRL